MCSVGPSFETPWPWWSSRITLSPSISARATAPSASSPLAPERRRRHLRGQTPQLSPDPLEAPAQSRTRRTAELKLDPDGSITGDITLTCRFLAADQQAAEAAAKDALQAAVPHDVQLKLVALKGLDTYNTPLTAAFTVSGQLGGATGKRILIPAQ
jgi:hypothetical protein